MKLNDRNYWLDSVAITTGSLGGLPQRADVVIVGAGFTGLSAARTLAVGGATVAVLEANTIGWGASSRNGGMVLTGMKLGVEALAKRYGMEATRRMYAASLACSINWNASITPSSGRGCAASPCWNRNAASATKPPANNASTSAVWLPMRPASPAPSVPTGPSRTACTGPWMSPSTTTRCAPAPRPQPIIWRCSNTSPSTLSDSTRSNGKAASKPGDSSPLPQTYTALNCSDSYDVHAIALLAQSHGTGTGL